MPRVGLDCPNLVLAIDTTGAALKLLGNGTLLGAIQLYSEMYALADRIGFDSATFYELHRAYLASFTSKAGLD